MFFKKNISATPNKADAPKSDTQLHHIRLVREAWWWVLVLVGLYLAVILGSYQVQDPSWFYMSSTNLVVENAGGKVGAVLSDILLNLFGFSAWWLVVLAFFTILLMYQQIEQKDGQRPFLLLNMVGFGLLLIASSTLEAGHIISLPADLPDAPGGIIGQSLDGLLRAMFGYAGSTMALLLLFAVGFSLFTGWSWIMMAEKLGAGIIFAYDWSIAAYNDWQDRRVGKIAEQKRAEFIKGERKRSEDKPPIEIKPAKTEVVKSERVFKEKQVSLFDSDTLPPLHLLDKANNTVELPSDETLAFTSRLIERKLADFGIEVNVLSAQPGPVITRYELDPAPGVKGSQITNLAKDLARALSVLSVRVVETIPGKSYMGLEIPNPKRQIVFLTEILGSKVYADMYSPLAIALGKDIAGLPVVADLAKMPHVLVAGTTGSGKSVAINALILSLV